MKVTISELGYIEIEAENEKELKKLNVWCDKNNYQEINANIFIGSEIG